MNKPVTSAPAKTAPTTPSTPSESANPYAGWETYTSTIGGFSLKYPPTWGISGFRDYNDYSAGELNGREDEVRIISNSAQNNSSKENNFGVQLNISTNSSATPYDTYGNGTTTLLANNITLWQEKEHINYATGPATDTCPAIQIGKDDTYSMRLANGKYLSIFGSFCWAQGLTTTESYAQQVASSQWNDAISIIKSVSF
jgi:hypothetical protein